MILAIAPASPCYCGFLAVSLENSSKICLTRVADSLSDPSTTPFSVTLIESITMMAPMSSRNFVMPGNARESLSFNSFRSNGFSSRSISFTNEPFRTYSNCGIARSHDRAQNEVQLLVNTNQVAVVLLPIASVNTDPTSNHPDDLFRKTLVSYVRQIRQISPDSSSQRGSDFRKNSLISRISRSFV